MKTPVRATLSPKGARDSINCRTMNNHSAHAYDGTIWILSLHLGY